MKKLSKFILLSALIALLGVMIVPALAQEEGGQGGIIIEGLAGQPPTTLDPILADDATASDIQNFIFPALMAVDPATQSLIANGPGALAASYEVSEDGTVYTFALRQDMFWNDGDQMDADDYMYSWEAVKSGQIEAPISYLLDVIVSVEKIDQFTVQVTFPQADCDALQDAATIPLYPAHIAPANFTDLETADFGINPTVSAGPFKFSEIRPGEAVVLLADQTYIDSELGYVSPEGFVYLSVPDLTVNVERFLAGELTVIDGPQEARRIDIYNAEAEGRVKVYRYPGNSWDYLSFNQADPNNPLPAFDADGNYQDQGLHPIFGGNKPDGNGGWVNVGKEVRQALNYALDIPAMGEVAAFGEVTPIPAHLVPSSWAFNTDLQPRGYDLEKAAQMLTDAGWVDHDNDVATPRICQGCGTTEDGTEMRFTILTNEENARRTAVITIAQQQWASIGVAAEIQTLEFNTLTDIMDTQTFDAFVLGWQNSYPDRPDSTQILTGAGDVPGGGSNNGSYYNPEFDRLNEEARRIPGCDPEARKEMYWQMQEIIQDDTPYVFLWARNGLYAVQSNVEGFEPYPSNLYWNVDTWSVSAD